MSGKIQIRLAILAALAALVAVVVPATFAAGDSTPVAADAGVIYLALGNGNGADVISYDGASQNIPTRNNDCTAVDALNPGDADSILVVTEIDALSLGESKNHIGTLGPGDGKGEPCALAAAGAGVGGADEGISVKVGAGVGGDVSMGGFSIDIRLKGNGSVKATTYGDSGVVDASIPLFTFEGPDNAPDSRDNFRWTYEAPAGMEFNEVRFVAVTGDFAMGGGADSTVPGAFDSSSHASQFKMVRAFDGELACEPDSADIGVQGVDLTFGTVTMRAENLNDETGWLVEDCRKKPFLADTAGTGLSFIPFDPAGFSDTSARYTLEVWVENQVITSDGSGQITSLIAEYDPLGSIDFPAGSGTPLQACRFAPPLDDTDQPAYDDFWSQADPVTQGGVEILPTSIDNACFFGAEVTPTGLNTDGETVGTEHWFIYFEDDPGLQFR